MSNEWEREERREARQRMFAKFRSLPTTMQCVTSVSSAFVVITLIQALIGVINNFIGSVLAPLVQWWVR